MEQKKRYELERYPNVVNVKKFALNFFFIQESDIFPLGIIFSYVLSDGVHPFGDDVFKRDENIRDGEPDLSRVKEECNIATNINS